MPEERTQKPSLKALCITDDCCLLYYAVIEHYRSWLFFDGPTQLAASRVGLEPHLRLIASNYLVGRGIPKGEEARLAKLIDSRSQKWPTGIMDRARYCKKLAKDCSVKKYTKGQLASAMTKFMWFVKPDEWTMFDRFAADGLGIRRLQSAQRMLLFYKTLDSFKFLDVVQLIEKKSKIALLRI